MPKKNSGKKEETLRKILFLTLTIIATISQAGVYKCQQNGKTVYSQTRCGADAQRLAIRNTNPSQADRLRAKQRLEIWDKQFRTEKLSKKRREILANADALRRQIIGLQAAMDRELATLRIKKTRANNNLPGAVWEQSISQEMAAITQRYQTRIKTIQLDIDRLLAAASRIEAKLDGSI